MKFKEIKKFNKNKRQKFIHYKKLNNKRKLIILKLKKAFIFKNKYILNLKKEFIFNYKYLLKRNYISYKFYILKKYFNKIFFSYINNNFILLNNFNSKLKLLFLYQKYKKQKKYKKKFYKKKKLKLKKHFYYQKKYYKKKRFIFNYKKFILKFILKKKKIIKKLTTFIPYKQYKLNIIIRKTRNNWFFLLTNIKGLPFIINSCGNLKIKTKKQKKSKDILEELNIFFLRNCNKFDLKNILTIYYKSIYYDMSQYSKIFFLLKNFQSNKVIKYMKTHNGIRKKKKRRI